MSDILLLAFMIAVFAFVAWEIWNNQKDKKMAGYFELKQAKNGHTYWNLKTKSHEVILTSEMYTSREGAENGMLAVQTNCTNPDRYETREQTNGKLYFVLKAGNGQVIGKSDAYESKDACKNGIQSVMVNGTTTEIKDKTGI